MSVKVDVGQLGDALADFTFAYLITVGDDYRAHTVAVQPVLHDGAFAVEAIGNTTRRNVDQHDGVTLVWPPTQPGGYTLIVDGRASATDDGLTVEAIRAVLHRPATPETPAKNPGCLHDCLPLEERVT
jgi:hypothetical protein